MHEDQERSPWLAVKLHTLFKLTPRAYRNDVDAVSADIPAVSTWRGKGSIAKHEDPTAETKGVGYAVAAAAEAEAKAATVDGAADAAPVTSAANGTANGTPISST